MSTMDPDGTIWVPVRAESEDGMVIGDAAFPLRPGDDGYDEELARVEKRAAMRAEYEAKKAGAQ